MDQQQQFLLSSCPGSRALRRRLVQPYRGQWICDIGTLTALYPPMLDVAMLENAHSVGSNAGWSNDAPPSGTIGQSSVVQKMGEFPLKFLTAPRSAKTAPLGRRLIMLIQRYQNQNWHNVEGAAAVEAQTRGFLGQPVRGWPNCAGLAFDWSSRPGTGTGCFFRHRRPAFSARRVHEKQTDFGNISICFTR
jgi:hypothetical protein